MRLFRRSFTATRPWRFSITNADCEPPAFRTLRCEIKCRDRDIALKVAYEVELLLEHLLLVIEDEDLLRPSSHQVLLTALKEIA